jgi:uncharacterized protein (TIGR02145 family)
MKKMLFVLLISLPFGEGWGGVLLSAQNGVTVSGLAINAGTATFDVSWDRDAMPVALWSDSVWVFVDYNSAGKMMRLPVTGITASAGTAVKVDGNDKGAWIIGNARANGSFSATVQMLTSAVGVAGACAYASNYPPVGEYVSDTEISFTGTLPYDIVLRNESGSTVTVQAGSTFLLPCDYTLASFTDATTGAPGIMKAVEVADCTAPGSTVTFTAFNPCEGAATGTAWYLTDTRTYGNNKTYKVKKMQDGHIWMVQDLMFGNCTASSWYNDNSAAATTHTPTVASGYVGHCRTTTYATAGYLYNWPAAMNNSLAYSGSTNSSFQCTGTGGGTVSPNPGACRGICPEGWHIPTGNIAGEFKALHDAPGRNCATNNDDCWDANSAWEGVYGGACYDDGGLTGQGQRADYLSSTFGNSGAVYLLLFTSSSMDLATSLNHSKASGRSVRCIKNY